MNDKIGLWLQIILAAAGVFATVVFGVLPMMARDNDEGPVGPNRSGIILEERRLPNEEGKTRDRSVVVIVRAPENGRWHSILCAGDQVDRIDGHLIVGLADAERELFKLDGGNAVTVLPAEVGARTIDLEPDSFTRC
jgi:hypothetical protein